MRDCGELSKGMVAVKAQGLRLKVCIAGCILARACVSDSMWSHCMLAMWTVGDKVTTAALEAMSRGTAHLRHIAGFAKACIQPSRSDVGAKGV